MKFSVLLPTRNRLKYLSYAIESILQQDYDAWEVIVSDNNSQEPILQYIEQIKDDRIKYFRTDSFVSVTENWNNSLNHCSGDYIIMLGDDDILLKHYFSTMIHLLNRYEQPDLIYTNAYIYTYPGVTPNHPEGMIHSCNNFDIFNHGDAHPFFLSKTAAQKLVQGHCNFSTHYGANMQFILINNSLINTLKINGLFFHTPYPDFYAMNALMLEAKKILVYPKETVAIGVTPKSTGNYLINNKEKKAMEFLNVLDEITTKTSLSSHILPGSFSLTAWLIAMDAVTQRFKKKCNLSLNYQRYQLLQIDYLLKDFFSKQTSFQSKDLIEAFCKISFKAKFLHFIPLFLVFLIKKLFPRFIRQIAKKIHDPFFKLDSFQKGSSAPISETFSNIFEIFEHHENGKLYGEREIKEILKAAQSSISTHDVCLAYGVSENTLSIWKRLYERAH